MILKNHALFQIAVKTIIRKGEDILVLMTPDGFYDFPGGRVDQTEVDLPLPRIVHREAVEELGSDFQFSVEKLAFVCKRYYDKEGKAYHVLAVYFESNYTGGEITLSDEHASSLWIKPEELLRESPNKFVSQDEYDQMTAYFKQ